MHTPGVADQEEARQQACHGAHMTQRRTTIGEAQRPPVELKEHLGRGERIVAA